MLSLDIDQLSDDLKKILSDGYIIMMYEAFLLIMDENNFNGNCNLNPHNSADNFLTSKLLLSWKRVIDERIKRTHRNQNQTTDFGAMLLSLGVITKIDKIKRDCGIGNFFFETSVTGTGIDFWISDESNPLTFKARVEISGIRKRTKTNNLRYRYNAKFKQARKSTSSGLPVYIGLVEFSQMEALIIQN